MRRIAILPLLMLLALPAVARAEEEHGKPVDVPAGEVRVGGDELRAGGVGTQIRLDVDLSKDPGNAALQVILPSLVDRTTGSPRLTDDASGRVDLAQQGHALTVDLDRARAGDLAEVSLEDLGLHAGTYDLPVRWVRADGSSVDAGDLHVTLHAGEREGDLPDWNRVGRVDIVATSDSSEESETFVEVKPDDGSRLITAANKSGDLSGGFLTTTDGGQSFTEHHVATQIGVPGGGTQSALVSGDPILAADGLGNYWAGGLTICTSTTNISRIFVDRLPAGSNSFVSPAVGLPVLHGSGQCDAQQEPIQDKPMMTIDNYPSSPTFGRLYVTWDDPDPGNGVNVVVSACDTRPGGVANAANCDNPDNWSSPLVLSGPPGSYVTSDSAVGPDGRVYVVWWDYANAALTDNSVQIVLCAAGSSNCRTGGWSSPAVLAKLTTNPTPPRAIPFACPMPAQPGGRAGVVPSIAVAPDGRIYAAWSDLRLDSASARCTQNSVNPNEQTWDSFVASAPSIGDLLASSDRSSASVGARVISDSGLGSDEWFPWVATDPLSGQAYVDFYSTTGDVTRRTAQFFMRGVGAGSGTQASFGPLQGLSAGPSDFSGNPCCNFGNDYGDYTGLSVGGGSPYGVWTSRSGLGDDGEIHVGVPGPSFSVASATVSEASGADGDGIVESNEPFRLDLGLRNDGAGNGTAIQGTINAPGGEASFDGGGALSFADEARRGGSSGSAVTGRFGSACGGSVNLQLSLSANDASQSLPVAVPVACPQAIAVTTAPILPVAPARTPTITAPSPGGKATVVRQKLSTVLRRGYLTARVSCTRTCTLRLTLLLPPPKGKRSTTITLARLTVKNLRKAKTVRLKLGKTSKRRLRASHRKTLTLQLVATTAAGGKQARALTVKLR